MNVIKITTNVFMVLAMVIGFSLTPSHAFDKKCSSYIRKFDDYQYEKKRLLDCGASPDLFFFSGTVEEHQRWCEQATPSAVRNRINELGLLSQHCLGIEHDFDIENNREDMKKRGLINSFYEPDIKAEPVSDAIRSAIIANPGKKTGAGNEVFPVILLEGKEPMCRLQGVKLKLAPDINANHWLVGVEPPCQHDVPDVNHDRRNVPFWLVEEQQGAYRVLLAYRTFDNVSIAKPLHQGYAQVNISQETNDGNSADISWQYQNGEYAYLSSSCTNLGRMDDSEPVFIKECMVGTQWH